jgi:hypothetical protein
MIQKTIDLLLGAGFINPVHGRTIYMSNDKQKKYYRSLIKILMDDSVSYNNVIFGDDKQDTTVDMIVFTDEGPFRIFITYFSPATSKIKFPFDKNHTIEGVFTFHCEEYFMLE